MLINTTSWLEPGEEDNKRDVHRFDKAEYKLLDPSNENDKESIKLILDTLNKVDNNPQKDKPKKDFQFKDGYFYKNGEKLEGEKLQDFVNSLNGFGYDTKLLGPKKSKANPEGWENKTVKYWDSYKISIAGSKIGKAINFNLPPVKTCNSGIPCTKQCYAVKAYAAYPGVRAAENCNLRLLKKDKGFELFKRSMTLALKTPTKKGKKFNLCRIHVSGDIISEDYFKAICDIATECDWVNFWMYTKQYEILASVSKSSIPSNLCVIVSCWGDFNPFDYKEGKYKQLAIDYPLAYLDDESEEVKALNQKIQDTLGKPKNIQVCPCTEAEEIITRCETCRICFDRSLADNNLVFKLH